MHGGKIPKLRLGLYNNKGWSDWQSFYTSVNANNIDTDWTAKKIYVEDKIGVGVQNLTEKLAVNGKIRATEIKVDSGPWPDFVFEENYKLIPLKDVEAFKLNNYQRAQSYGDPSSPYELIYPGNLKIIPGNLIYAGPNKFK